jgi:hypothetical protein
MPTSSPSLSMTHPYRGNSPAGSGRWLKQEKIFCQKLRGRSDPYPRVSRSMAAGMSASVISRTLIRGNVSTYKLH